MVGALTKEHRAFLKELKAVDNPEERRLKTHDFLRTLCEYEQEGTEASMRRDIPYEQMMALVYSADVGAYFNELQKGVDKLEKASLNGHPRGGQTKYKVAAIEADILEAAKYAESMLRPKDISLLEGIEKRVVRLKKIGAEEEPSLLLEGVDGLQELVHKGESERLKNISEIVKLKKELQELRIKRTILDTKDYLFLQKLAYITDKDRLFEFGFLRMNVELDNQIHDLENDVCRLERGDTIIGCGGHEGKPFAAMDWKITEVEIVGEPGDKRHRKKVLDSDDKKALRYFERIKKGQRYAHVTFEHFQEGDLKKAAGFTKPVKELNTIPLKGDIVRTIYPIRMCGVSLLDEPLVVDVFRGGELVNVYGAGEVELEKAEKWFDATMNKFDKSGNPFKGKLKTSADL